MNSTVTTLVLNPNSFFSVLLPYNVWIDGVVRLRDSDYIAIDSILTPAEIILHGIDPEGPVPYEEEYQVSVPTIQVDLGVDQVNLLHNAFPDPTQDDGEFGRMIYIQLLHLLNAA